MAVCRFPTAPGFAAVLLVTRRGDSTGDTNMDLTVQERELIEIIREKANEEGFRLFIERQGVSKVTLMVTVKGERAYYRPWDRPSL
jgi:hypothetical protein